MCALLCPYSSTLFPRAPDWKRRTNTALVLVPVPVLALVLVLVLAQASLQSRSWKHRCR